jgi:hypothetical protein
MADRKLRRQLYDQICARIRGESDAEATRQLILEAETDDRGYWVVLDQVQSLLPEQGPPDVSPQERQVLARCLLLLRASEEYRWESAERRGCRAALPATFIPPALLGAGAVLIWVIAGRQGITYFYSLIGLGLAWLLVGYWLADRRRGRGRVDADLTVWPFYDAASYRAACQVYGDQLRADSAGALELTQNTCRD